MFKSIRLVSVAIICLLASQFAAAGDQVPFKLQASATTLTAPIFVGTHMYLTASGPGSASHMGNVTFVAPHDFDLAAGPMYLMRTSRPPMVTSFISSPWVSS